MNKKKFIILSVIIGVLAVLSGMWIFWAPTLFNLNTYKAQFSQAVKQQTGLDFSARNLDYKTNLNLSIDFSADDVKINQDGKKLLTLKNASVNVPLVPLLSKNIEIKGFKLNQPEIAISRDKNGKYSFESIFANIKPSDSSQKQQFKLVNGIDAEIKNYKLQLDDYKQKSPQKFVLSGDLIKVSDFNPDKQVKLETKGKLFVQDKQNIAFDVKFKTELPFAAAQNTPSKKETPDILEQFVKYNLKSNISADIELKNVQKEPDINGFISFDGLTLKIKNKILPASNGKIDFKGKSFNVDSKLYITPASYASVNGEIHDIAKNKLNLAVKTTEINFEDLKDFLESINDIANANLSVLDDFNIAGKLKADFKITDNSDFSGYLSILNTNIAYKKISKPIQNLNSTIKFADKKINFVSTYGFLDANKFVLSGFIDSKNNADLKFNINSFKSKTIIDLINQSSILKEIKPQIKDIRSLSGAIKLEAVLNGNLNKQISPEIIITPLNITIFHKQMRFPVSLTSGKITTDGEKAEIKNLKIKASSSNFNVIGSVKTLAKMPEIDLIANGYISGVDIKKYSSAEVKKSIFVKGDVPVNISVAGYMDGWKLTSQARIDNIHYVANINTNGSKILSLNLKGTPSSVSFFDSGLSSSAGQKLVSLTGGINNYSSKSPSLNNVQIALSNLNLSIVEPKGRLQLNGLISAAGNLSKPRISGNISAKNISMPSMYLTSNNVDVALKNSEILVNTGIINIQDSKFKINMALNNNFASPLVIKNINVSSDYMNADKLQKAFPAVPNQDTPVIIKHGHFSAEKMVFNGLPANNTAFDFVINPMNIMKMTNLTTSAAGGTASGKVNMNLKTSRVSANIHTNNMEINTLSTIFANTPNEIYGAMDGNINISTYGYTPEQTANNASGDIKFTVTNGKLVRLGSITHLLKAKNILSEGIGLQMLENIVDFKEANTSNQFKKLVGNISVDNGTLFINELSSQGGDMSLFSRGTIRMSNNIADISTYGTLSDRITSKLGKVPSFSVEKLINDKLTKKLPGQWGQVLADLRPKPQIPQEVSKIPPLSRGSRETDKHFLVKIQGNLYKPSSVKSFKLID
jgi:uncharacterized protein involved in outer membrane biogenesis